MSDPSSVVPDLPGLPDPAVLERAARISLARTTGLPAQQIPWPLVGIALAAQHGLDLTEAREIAQAFAHRYPLFTGPPYPLPYPPSKAPEARAAYARASLERRRAYYQANAARLRQQERDRRARNRQRQAAATAPMPPA